MDAITIHRLNAINREFYQVTATEFNQTRGRAWPGWELIVPHLPSPISVLDVGCGNGRFGVFLAASGAGPLRYYGIDNNAALLQRAGVALAHLPDVRLEMRDIVENPLDDGEYDLVALFGVLHHIPGTAQRQALMRALATRVHPDGLLVFAAWRFYEYERFRQRIVPWPDDYTVEAHDYLLDWRRGEVALRYCHYVDDAEQDALVAATALHEIRRYRADGFDGRVNSYSLLIKR